MCTRTLWNTNQLGVFASRTMDWPTTTDPRLVVFPRGTARDGGMLGPSRVIDESDALTWTATYGSLVTTTYGLGTADGINEAGLGAHFLFFTSCDFGEPRPGRRRVHAGLWAQPLLDQAATVAEALDVLDEVDLVMVGAMGFKTTVHVAIEDATGDSAIIEYVAGEKQVHHGREHVIMTNDPRYEDQLAVLAEQNIEQATRETVLPGNVNPRDRFVRAAYYTHHLPEPANEREAVAGVMAIARNVSVPFGAPYKEVGTVYNTEYRTVADLTNGRYFFELTTNPSIVWAQLGDFDLSPGQPARILDPHDIALAGDVGASFTTLDPVPF